MLAQYFIRIVIDEIDGCPDVHPFPGRPNHERGLAAFGNRKHHIPHGDLEVTKLLFAKLREILKPFDRFDERIVASGHHGQGAVLEFLDRRRAGQPARALALPEIAPDGSELDA